MLTSPKCVFKGSGSGSKLFLGDVQGDKPSVVLAHDWMGVDALSCKDLARENLGDGWELQEGDQRVM